MKKIEQYQKLIKENIGVLNKPSTYYSELKKLEQDLKFNYEYDSLTGNCLERCTFIDTENYIGSVKCQSCVHCLKTGDSWIICEKSNN